jgi:hypothetical protein
MESPVYVNLVQWCQDNKYRLQDGLIQNSKSINITDAKKSHKEFILRWRHRICMTCQETFDICDTGLFYKCKRC